ncbi:MAG: TolC family protein [Deferribacteres bacterium]|nr:TolC family protein [Deferribacteres bacterium]
MKKVLLFIFFLSFLIPCSLHAQELSLDDLYRLALKKSETIKISEENVYIAEKEKDRALSTLIPRFSAFGYHTRYSEEKSVNASLMQPEYTNEWGLRLDQSFSLSGRELTALRIAKQGIKQSLLELNAAKEEYLFSVASSYYNVLKSKKALEIARANVQRLTKHRDAARTRLEVGKATKTALLRAEAQLAGAQSELIRAENNLRLAKSVLARTAGISGEYDLREPDSDGTTTVHEEELKLLIGDCRMAVLDCLKERALSERPEIKGLRIQRQIAEDRVRYARGAYWPRLSIEGVYYRQENEPSTSLELKERIYGALKLEFPFFEGGLRVAEVAEAKARLRQAEHSLSDLKQSISVEVENSYLNLLAESAVISRLKAEAAYARDNYNAVSKQFLYGLADSVAVMDANTLLITAERQLANAGYDYQLSILRLRKATGTLLKQIISENRE